MSALGRFLLNFSQSLIPAQKHKELEERLVLLSRRGAQKQVADSGGFGTALQRFLPEFFLIGRFGTGGGVLSGPLLPRSTEGWRQQVP